MSHTPNQLNYVPEHVVVGLAAAADDAERYWSIFEGRVKHLADELKAFDKNINELGGKNPLDPEAPPEIPEIPIVP